MLFGARLTVPQVSGRPRRWGCVRGTWWVVLVTVPVAVAIGLPFAYGVAFSGCAPPGIVCLLPWVACAAVCGHAWTQFPDVAVVGAVTGIAPALLASGLVFVLERRIAMNRVRRWAIWTLAGTAGIAVVSEIAVVVTCASRSFAGLTLAFSSAVLAAENLLPSMDLDVGDAVAGP